MLLSLCSNLSMSGLELQGNISARGILLSSWLPFFQIVEVGHLRITEARNNMTQSVLQIPPSVLLGSVPGRHFTSTTCSTQLTCPEINMSEMLSAVLLWLSHPLFPAPQGMTLLWLKFLVGGFGHSFSTSTQILSKT